MTFGITLAAVLFMAARRGEAQTPQTPPQAPEQAKPELVIPVGTEVVRVDVIVTDKGGKARPSLRREDFQIVENGQPQTITQFEAFAASAAPSEGPLPPPCLPRPRSRHRRRGQFRAASSCWSWTTSISKPPT